MQGEAVGRGSGVVRAALQRGSGCRQVKLATLHERQAVVGGVAEEGVAEAEACVAVGFEDVGELFEGGVVEGDVGVVGEEVAQDGGAEGAAEDGGAADDAAGEGGEGVDLGGDHAFQ